MTTTPPRSADVDAHATWGVDGAAPDMTLADSVTLDDLRAASKRIEGWIDRTPVVRSDELDRLVGARVHLKCENLQRIGAFKLRGAFSAMTDLSAEQRAAGVLAYSSGNHAQAVAMASTKLGVRAVIVMPENAPRVKLERTRAQLVNGAPGSRVEMYDPFTTNREELGRLIMEREGLTLVPPYDHPGVIAGQGTATLELIEEVGELDEVYICVGGGGLLSGGAIAAKALCRACRVIGVEPELADDAARSFRDGVLRTVSNSTTIADGARTPFLGRYTFPLMLRYVDEMMTVSEREIARAMAWTMAWLRLVIEPSGGLGLAGLLKARGDKAKTSARQEPLRVGVILSGGNVDLAKIPELLAMAE